MTTQGAQQGTMSKHTAYVEVMTPDGPRPFERDNTGAPILRSREQCEAIAKQARELAARNGWRLRYSVVGGE